MMALPVDHDSNGPMSQGHGLLERIRAEVIGGGESFDGPFGRVPLVYADYMASGRALGWIEDAIRNHVLPCYANTHTETSFTGHQTTRLREDARLAVRAVIGADKDVHIIFCGSGATGAGHVLVGLLDLLPWGEPDSVPPLRPEVRPVVFVGPFEHHSNDLPWRESGADVVRIRLGPEGEPDLAHVEEELGRHAARPVKIGAFSAASNVTGVVADVRTIASRLHASGALAIFDYAAGGPYLPIRMAESAPGAAAT